MKSPARRGRWHRATAALIVVALVSLVVSCLKGRGKAPDVALPRTLAPVGEVPAASATKTFAVVFAAPQGAVVDPSEISIVWNRPIHSLELVAEQDHPPATVTRRDGGAVAGSWRWVGTSAVVFAPVSALPGATEFVVTVPRGMKSTDGAALADEYRFSFSTPPPKLLALRPSEDGEHLTPKSTFELRFNQPVDPREVERATQIRVGDKATAWPFRATVPRQEMKTLVKLVPSTPLPLSSKVEVVVDGSLRGTEGPLTLGAPATIALSTFGPLAALRFECSRETPNEKCGPGASSLRILMSNGVRCKDWEAHVRVTPPVPARSLCEDDASQTELTVPGKLAPAKSYMVTITAGLKDEYGQALARAASFPFETDDEWPSVAFGLEGSVFEAGKPAPAADSPRPGERIIPIASVNTGAYELIAGALDESDVARYLASAHETFDEAVALLKAKVEIVKPTAARNVSSVRNVALDPLMGATGRGAALVGIRSRELAPRRNESDLRLVAATDLAISAKMSRFGSVVWVTRLSDAQPVPHATVAVRDKQGKEVFATRADDSGIALIPPGKYNPVVGGEIDEGATLFAREGGDWTFKGVADRIGDWRVPVATDVSGGLAPIGMLFTERGVYRPGETVRVKGIFRQPNARTTETPEGLDVHVEVADASGENLFQRTVKLDAFGEFAVDVPLPATAHLGTGELSARVAAATEDHAVGTASAGILLAEYKPAEFKVEVEPDKPSFARGDAANFQTHGDYLFGAPMGGARVHFTLTRGPGHFEPPGAEGLVMDDDAFTDDLASDNLRAGQLQSGDGALNAHGAMSVKTDLAMPGQRGTELVTFEAEVEDVSRQTIAARATAIVHPADFYIALKPPKDQFVGKGDVLRPEVTAVAPGGAKRQGVSVHVALIRRSWHSVLEATSASGRHYTSRPVDKVLSGCDVATTEGAVSCDLAVTDVGYLLVHATSKDRRNNPVGASLSLYALGDGADVGWRMSDSTELDLVPDRSFYEVGDVAKVLVKSPFLEATALVTVERSGVYRQERQTLVGAMPTLSFPVTEDMRPNAYVSVQLVRGRAGPAPAVPPAGQELAPDTSVPAFRLGYATLTVNPEARRLAVDVVPVRTMFGPGDTVDADVRVVDREGQPVVSAVTFSVVDEGVLMLTGYKTPDPVPIFTAPRPLAVFSLESRDALARWLVNPKGGAGLDKGSAGGGGGSVRADFRATAYFEPSLRTGGDGKVHVHFKLPDGLTTYRLMAVAAAKDDRFGFGDAQVATSRPLMARPAMPRFLRAGDSVDAGVVVTSKGMPTGHVEVRLTATGVTLKGDEKRAVTVPAGGSTEVRWAIAAPLAGKAEFAFSVRPPGGAGPALDEVRVSRNVEVPLSTEAVALYGETTGSATETLGDLSAMRDDAGGLDVRLASTALVGLDEGVEALIQYPYGCTEQLASRLVALIPLVGLAKDYHVDLPPHLDSVIDEAVAKILKNQQADGRFGGWIDSTEGNDWLTAYALWALTVAKNAGHPVPSDAIDRATQAVRNPLADWEKSPSSRADAAWFLDVLAMVARPDTGYMDLLYEERDKLPLFARALLAHAMALSGSHAREVGQLLGDAESHLRVTSTGASVAENVGSDYSVFMDSEAWATAIVLRALVAANPAHPLAARIAAGLMALRKGGTWRSTEETAWALLALDDYRRAQERDAPDFEARFSFGGSAVFSAPFRKQGAHPASMSFSASKLLEMQARGTALGFEVDGKGKLFYEARLRYAKKELPVDEIDRGFTVHKLVRSLRQDGLRGALATLPESSASSAVAGDLVLVDLFLVTPDPRAQVVLDDPLPAGLEAVDASLATSARALDVTAEANGDGNDEQGESARANALAYGETYHREVHDDRVLTFVEHMPAGIHHYRYLARATTVGTFVVPPTRAECMYEPETFGRTGATTFVVRAR